MKILGIDPGTATVGYGAIEIKKGQPKCTDVGVIKTSKSKTDSERLQKIYKEVKSLIKKIRPDALAVEKIYFSKNIKTAMAVSQARGIVLLAGQEEKVEIFECSPQEVKMSVAGYGNAGKKQVQRMVKTLLNLKKIPKPDDAADALAAALSTISKLKKSKRISKM